MRCCLRGSSEFLHIMGVLSHTCLWFFSPLPGCVCFAFQITIGTFLKRILLWRDNKLSSPAQGTPYVCPCLPMAHLLARSAEMQRVHLRGSKEPMGGASIEELTGQEDPHLDYFRVHCLTEFIHTLPFYMFTVGDKKVSSSDSTVSLTSNRIVKQGIQLLWTSFSSIKEKPRGTSQGIQRLNF